MFFPETDSAVHPSPGVRAASRAEAVAGMAVEMKFGGNAGRKQGISPLPHDSRARYRIIRADDGEGRRVAARVAAVAGVGHDDGRGPGQGIPAECGRSVRPHIGCHARSR